MITKPVDINNRRLIGFGRYAGIVGAYNSIRAFGLKFELFKLPKRDVVRKEELISTKKEYLPIKVVITGTGGGWRHKRDFRCHENEAGYC
jgi:hypothetical protein